MNPESYQDNERPVTMRRLKKFGALRENPDIGEENAALAIFGNRARDILADLNMAKERARIDAENASKWAELHPDNSHEVFHDYRFMCCHEECDRGDEHAFGGRFRHKEHAINCYDNHVAEALGMPTSNPDGKIEWIAPYECDDSTYPHACSHCDSTYREWDKAAKCCNIHFDVGDYVNIVDSGDTWEGMCVRVISGPDRYGDYEVRNDDGDDAWYSTQLLVEV
jgi:hypothetical protein